MYTYDELFFKNCLRVVGFTNPFYEFFTYELKDFIQILKCFGHRFAASHLIFLVLGR